MIRPDKYEDSIGVVLAKVTDKHNKDESDWKRKQGLMLFFLGECKGETPKKQGLMLGMSRMERMRQIQCEKCTLHLVRPTDLRADKICVWYNTHPVCVY